MRLCLWLLLPICLLTAAAERITDHGGWWDHMRYLAQDGRNGLTPDSEGHRRAAAYVSAELQKAGVRAAGSPGYIQTVKLRSRRILEQYSELDLVRGATLQPISLGGDAVVDMLTDPAPNIQAPLVFIGYGLSVPELHHDDLEGLDLHGKIAVILRGAPAYIPGPVRARYESAAERDRILRQRAGVFGIVTIENPKRLSAPWSRYSASRFDAAFSLADPAFEQDDQLELAVAFNPGRAEMLFEGSGHSFSELLELADAGKPLPRFPLPATLRARVAVERSEVESQNVVGLLPGSDPKLRSEYVVLSAHLDYPALALNSESTSPMEDGAGAASVLDLAGLLHDSAPRLRRSLLFVFFTGAEKGLLGSEYFAQYPPVNTASIVAQLNVDMVPPLFPLRAITVYGLSESDLGAQIQAVGKRMGVAVQADPDPQWDISIRGDQDALIRRGVPGVGFKISDEAASMRGQSLLQRTKERHRMLLEKAAIPADQACVARFDAVVLEVVKGVANRTEPPHWLPESSFSRFTR